MAFAKKFKANLQEVEMNEKRPNVVFVLTDDQGYGDLGCTGNPDIQTPQIDEFYKEAVRLTDYHVAPLCAPTRGAIFTGRRPFKERSLGHLLGKIHPS